MDQEQQSLVKYALMSVVAIGISLVLIALIGRVGNVAPQTDVSARTVGMVDDSFLQVNLYIENSSGLRETLAGNYGLALDQILQERYNKTSKVERHAVVDGGVERKGDNVSFRLKFQPSNQAYDCVVTSGNENEGVSVSMEAVQ